MNRDKDENKDSGFIWVTVITIIVIIGLWLMTYYKLRNLTETDRGTFGDMFGSINSLFSGLALAGIILSILLQRKELSLQRQELKDSREELKRTATAQENSEKALNRQAENLKISAKLTALNTLVNYYSDLEKSPTVSFSQIDSKRKKEDCVRKIEEILKQKEL